MKMIKLSLKISKIVFIGVITTALLFNLVNIFKRVILKEQLPIVFGYGSAIIVTGSMEPVIMPGDLVIIRKQNDYKPDDIVTYRGNNNPITHRILIKTPDGYITGGDANNTDDGEINKSRIIGKVVKIIPDTGNIIILQSPFGMLVLIAGLFLMIEAPKFIGKARKHSKVKGAKNI